MAFTTEETQVSPDTGFEVEVPPNVVRTSISTMLKKLASLPDVDFDAVITADLASILEHGSALERMLMPLVFEGSPTSTSLLKLLLRVEQLQPTVLSSLLESLPNMDEDSPLINRVLFSIRWIEVIYREAELAETVLQTLAASPPSIQKELIQILPDLISDVSADEVIATLIELKEDDPSLLPPILEAASVLNLSSASIQSITDETLQSLEAADPIALHHITNFLMTSAPVSSAEQVISNFRSKLVLPSSQPPPESGVLTASTLTIECLSRGFQYRSDLTTALITSLLSTLNPSAHTTADVWLLLCANTSHNTKQVALTARKKASNGTISSALVSHAIENHADCLEPLFPAAIALADSLIRAPEPGARLLGSSIYLSLFKSFPSPMSRQSVIAAITTHIGSGEGQEVDAAMKALQTICRRDADSLKQFSPFVLSLLSSLASLSTANLRRLFIVLFAVNDDDIVHIMIRKHLSHKILEMKRIGIIGATAFAVGRSACLRNDWQARVGGDSEGDKEGSALETQGLEESKTPEGETMAPVMKEISEVLTLANDACPAGPALAFLFDELALAIKGKQIAPVVKDFILNKYSTMLEDVFIGEVEQLVEESLNVDILPDVNQHEDCISPVLPEDKELVNMSATTTAQTTTVAKGELRYNEDGKEAAVYLRILPFVMSDDLVKSNLPSTLVPLLRLLAACHDPRYGGEGLSEIDAVIGAPLLIPAESLSMDFEDLPQTARRHCLEATFTATNWIRELINSFVHDAAFPNATMTHGSLYDNEEIRNKIVQRLKALIDLEDDLSHISQWSEGWAGDASGDFSVPLANDDEDDSPVSLPPPPNCEELTKEEAKEAMKAYKMQASEIKKVHKARNSEKNRAITKARKEREKRRGLLRDKIMGELRALHPHVVLALGFQSLAAVPAGQSQMLQSHVKKTYRIGNNVTKLLFEMMTGSLAKAFGCNQSSVSFFGKRKKDASVDEDEDGSGENPYVIIGDCTAVEAIGKVSSLLETYLEGGVFTSVHEHLSVMVEICGKSGELDEDMDVGEADEFRKKVDLCIGDILGTVRLLCGNEVLTSSKGGRQVLFRVLQQLAMGESPKRGIATMPVPSALMQFLRPLKALFDMVEEVCSFPSLCSLSFAMEIVKTLEKIISCSERLIACMKEGSGVNALDEANKTVLAMNKRVGSWAYTFLQKDWCPEIFRKSSRGKFKYGKGDVGVLVRLYIESSGSSKAEHDKMVPKIVRDMPASQIGKLGALDMLAKDVIPRLCELENSGKNEVLEEYPTLTAQSLQFWYEPVLAALSKELEIVFGYKWSKLDLCMSKIMECVKVLVDILKSMGNLVKENEDFVKKPILLALVKGGGKFVEMYNKCALPFFTDHFDDMSDEIAANIQQVQLCTRNLQNISNHAKRQGDVALSKETPKLKKILELFIYAVKAMFKKNNVVSSLWHANLKAKNIDGTLYKGSDEDDEDEEEDADSEDDDDDSDDGGTAGEGFDVPLTADSVEAEIVGMGTDDNSDSDNSSDDD